MARRSCGFTGRIIHDDPPRQILKSLLPAALFDMNRDIFLVCIKPREAIRKSDVAVIVEVNLDVAKASSSGR